MGKTTGANASDPQIPAALTPVVAGVASLHNFPLQPAHNVGGVFSKSRVTGQVQAVQPGYTTTCGTNSTCYFIGPYDFATIYNVLPLWTGTPAIDGTGQTIAIVGESNIVVQDVRDFRNLFGLLPNDPQVIVDGPDPGLVKGAETEADLDVEWSGAVAKGATIKLVIAASTSGTSGVNLAAVYAVENNIAPIISESFLRCELSLGTIGNAFENALRQQAAAQGITFINAAGDEGAAGCDFFQGSTPAPATQGLMVNGLASSPYAVAVGGTDFLNFPSYNFQSPSPYWNPSPTNDPHQASALGYVPETTWNSTCTNHIFVVFNYGSTPEVSCNNPQAQNYVETFAGGGGRSNCIMSNGSTPLDCLGGYAKPSWQSAPGVPQDGVRDIPDVSLFASGGFMNSAYIVCEADHPGLGSFGSCGGTTSQYAFLAIGGTSASAPAFAGIMALVNQYTKSTGQGNANYVLYKLASSQTQKNSLCNSSASPVSACIFNDVTAGTIEVPCAANSPDCNVSNGADTYGVLSGYSAGAGYDLATGLGSVNASNLVHNWNPPTVKTTTTLSLNSGKAVSITHGQAVPVSITVFPSAATGDVLLIGSPTAGSSIAMGSFTLQNGTATSATSTLAGGGATSYQVVARYAGDATYAPSESSPMSVMVAPELSNTLITIPVFDPTGKETGNTPTSVVYGSPYIARMDVGNTKETVTFPMKPLCMPLSCPTGSVTLTDSVAGGTPTTLGVFPLNLLGYADYLSIQLGGGAHQLTATYPGDNSYQGSAGSYSLAVTPAPTQASPPNLGNQYVVGTQISFGTNITTNVFSSAEPTGTIMFYDGAAQIPGTVTLSGAPGTSSTPSSLSGNITAAFSTSGTRQITARYSGDANYGAATSSPTTVQVLYPTTTLVAASATNINLGQNVTLTATATSSAKSPAMTGTFQFYSQLTSPIGGPVTPLLGTDANGNQVLTASVTYSPQTTDEVQVLYLGDTNFNGSGATATINVKVPDFAMPTNSSVVITEGQPFSNGLTVTPLSNVSSSVALTCSVAIAEASCSLNPASVNLVSGTAASATLSVTTLPPSTSPSTSHITIRVPKTRRGPPSGLSLLAVVDGVAVLLLFLSTNRKRRRLATGLGMLGLLFSTLSCGSGGGGGGGGGTAYTSSTTTLMTSAVKVPAGATLTLTATVSSAAPAFGTVTFLDAGNPFGSAAVSDGSATLQVSNLSVGTHVLSAQYSGGGFIQPSQTHGSINQVVTGTAQILVTGTTSNITHNTVYNATIQ